MKILNKIIIIIIAFVGLYAAFLIASDINTISEKISSFKIEFLISKSKYPSEKYLKYG